MKNDEMRSACRSLDDFKEFESAHVKILLQVSVRDSTILARYNIFNFKFLMQEFKVNQRSPELIYFHHRKTLCENPSL